MKTRILLVKNIKQYDKINEYQPDNQNQQKNREEKECYISTHPKNLLLPIIN